MEWGVVETHFAMAYLAKSKNVLNICPIFFGKKQTFEFFPAFERKLNFWSVTSWRVAQSQSDCSSTTTKYWDNILISQKAVFLFLATAAAVGAVAVAGDKRDGVEGTSHKLEGVG